MKYLTMNRLLYILPLALLLAQLPSHGQGPERGDVRRGNRDFRKEAYKEADVDYRKALLKDSLSIAANYNLANTLFREGNYEEAGKSLEKIGEAVAGTPYEADCHYNAGDVAIQRKDWQAAVDELRRSLLLNPGDMDAKENYVYAKKMLENQKNGGGGGGGQDQQDQDSQQGQDDSQDQQNQDQDQDRQDNGDGGQGQDGQEPKISPQQAQQMLQAIQAKEKETQDKVNKEKAEVLKSRQKEKNW